MDTAVLIAGTTSWFSASYKLARKAVQGSDVLLTSNFNKVRTLIIKDLIKKVIIVLGSRQKPAHDAYKDLKEINPKVKFIVMDSWTWTLRKSDRMILLPVTDLIKTIRENL